MKELLRSRVRRLPQLLVYSVSIQWAFVQSICLLSLVTLGLRILSFRSLCRGLRILARQNRKSLQKSYLAAEQMAALVRIASRYVPAANCLPQALTLQVLLRRQSYPTHLRIGIVRSENGQLKAHAWLENERGILIGELEDMAQYTLLSPIEEDIL